MPRQGKIFVKLRNEFKMSAKQYRKFLVENTEVVKNLMCEKKLHDIKFDTVPSVAMARYTNAFFKNAPEEFEQHKKDLPSGKVKAKTSVLYPYNVLNKLRNGDAEMAEFHWRDFSTFLADCNILPMVDVSGSMSSSIGNSITAMDVAISMGIYIAERLQGESKNLF